MTPNTTRTISWQVWNSHVEYPSKSRESKPSIKEFEGNMFNQIFKREYLGAETSILYRGGKAILFRGRNSHVILNIFKLSHSCINSSPPGENGCHFADNIFTRIFLNEKFCILIRISLKFVPKGQIDNKWALVHAMAWHQIGNKPLPEPMLIKFTNTYLRHWGEMS